MCEITDIVIFLFLVICSLSDIRTRKIPTIQLLAMSVTVFWFCLSISKQTIFSTVAGLLLGGAFWLFSRVTKEAIGYGDSWMILLLGSYLGGKKSAELIVIAFFLAGLFSIAGLFWKNWRRTYAIPFIPFLTVAYVWVVFG